MVYRIAVYGKGGIGKSTISANLSYLLSFKGSVLHVGCDPKHDSTRMLVGGHARAFVADADSIPLMVGLNDIGCIECGGPVPGTGCAGKGLELLFSKIRDVDSDYRVCDVLGDVVCGGFSVPARRENCDGVIIITSNEFMSLYAANNLLKGISNFNPERSVIGLVENKWDPGADFDRVSAFSRAVGVPLICRIPHSDLFVKAETASLPLCKIFPESEEASVLSSLAEFISSGPELYSATPLSEDDLGDLAAGRVPIGRCRPSRGRECVFERHDYERNLTYTEGMAMPLCTSHGAVDGALKILDAATVVHGSANCAYLGEYAYRRRNIGKAGEQKDLETSCRLYSTSMNSMDVFASRPVLDDVIVRVREDGFRYAVLVPTCISEIIGIDLRSEAARLSGRYGVDVIPAVDDGGFLVSKFGGSTGLFKSLIDRMPPMEMKSGTVNLLSRLFHEIGDDRNMGAIENLLALLGLRVHCRFLDQCRMSDLQRFRAAEFDLQIGKTSFNDSLSECLSGATGRRRALPLDMPHGLCGSLAWVRDIASYTGQEDLVSVSMETLRGRFEAGISQVRERTEGRTAVIYSVAARDVKWQVETLQSLGMEVTVMFSDGRARKHYENTPDPGVPVIDSASIPTLLEFCGSERPDLVVTNDSKRVARLGLHWAPLSDQFCGVDGAVHWASVVADCLLLPACDWEVGI